VSPADIALLSGMILAAAMLYTSVGHAGASGYVAAMALFGLSPAVMKPTALTLNVLVATLATYRWNNDGRSIQWRTLLPLVALSVPLAFLGGAMQLPGHWYRALVGLVLLVAGAKLVFQPRTGLVPDATGGAVPWLPGLVVGGVVGLLSGLTGTGGGIFLSPVLLYFGWTGTKQASGITAPFILVNSLAGLAGNLTALRVLPAELPYFIVAALTGALIGTQLGIKVAAPVTLARVLGVVLLIAAGKFLLS
jgi:hypothetical protein